LITKHAHGLEPLFAGAYGPDFNNFDRMETISFEGGLWPEHKNWGFQSYVEYADPSCDDEMWTIGAEPIWRYKTFYTGFGLALSDERLCNLAGTKWNFSITLGLRISKRFDIQWRHRSHGADLGILEDTPNLGINLIQLRVRR
ncbi:MAG: hypothetical protein GTO41_11565, partial [Burkholderiales bacterium]|nr:hypothetical protein [Burkholderiales bacterium]